MNVWSSVCANRGRAVHPPDKRGDDNTDPRTDYPHRKISDARRSTRNRELNDFKHARECGKRPPVCEQLHWTRIADC